MATILEHLIKDHVRLKEIFAAYLDDPTAYIDKLKELLDTHTTVEEAILYPSAESFAPEDAAHAREEHDEAKELLDKLVRDPSNANIFTALRHGVEHHAAEEESEFFPKITANIPNEVLVEMDAQADHLEEELNTE